MSLALLAAAAVGVPALPASLATATTTTTATAGSRPPTSGEARVLDRLATAQCLQHAGPGSGRCTRKVTTRVSLTDQRFALAGRIGEGYSGTIFHRASVSSLTFRPVLVLGGGSLPCVASHGVPALVLRDLRACYQKPTVPAGVRIVAGTWLTHGGSLVVSSSGSATLSYTRVDPSTGRNEFPTVVVKLTRTVTGGAAGAITRSDDVHAAVGGQVTLTRSTRGVRAALPGGYVVNFCDQKHRAAGDCGA
ncbi:MAG: hypothetical protein JWM93_1925 [Frankiales bacterium]|nr:hypothetical protein [Frankiales bacterium]